ncbi:MAG: glycosyl hydrolase, partial [Weeksellaceae bacterium]|nr:glycosyl hydrolase [Weeksellaceae bacterium]
RVDVSIGEFWAGLSTLIQHNYEHRRTVKLCASIAHTWGRKIIGAESFTAEPPSGKWQQYPFALKALGDKYFTEGLTRIIFHRYAMQPHPNSNVAPGMTMAYWGIHFDRTNTWWEQGCEWITYLSRCQYLLQQGLFVADFAYFSGEGAPAHTTVFRDELHPVPPEGYDYDLVNKEVILTRMKIKNGHIVLPDGMSYQILVTQDFDTMSLELVQKLYELVNKGMILVGTKPKRTPGLGKQSGDDAAMLCLADKLWGPIDGKLITEHRLGKGRVFWGESMDSILNKLSLEKDFECTSRSGDAPVRYIHKKTEKEDIYFVCNERRQYEDMVCTFRITGKQPEFWSAPDGKRFKAIFYENKEGRTILPIHLKPYGSLFVIFRSPATIHFKKLVSQEKCLFQTDPFPKAPQIKYEDVINNFSICLWAKPEIDIMLESGFGYREWTEYYAIYPPSGKELYGAGHETCGLTIGRNGVAIWHREEQWPVLKWAFPASIEGWTHIAVIYQEGIPTVYLNEKLIKGENKHEGAQKTIIHPGLGKAFIQDGASYYNGDISKVQLFKKVMNETEIKDLITKTKKEIQKEITKEAEIDEGDVPAILFMKNGNYQLTDMNGHSKAFEITEVNNQIELAGEWIVRFPDGKGAPKEIKLQKLISLHKHDIEGVKYFSGMTTYMKKFYIEKTMLKKNKRLFLDLGRVEVSAEVFLNGKALGVLWTRPYEVEITNIVKEGENNLLIRVANLWPNRLIGDEQLPSEYEYEPFQNYFGACIKKMPEWYLNGGRKPPGKRIAFTTWQHYQKNDPLLESGLIGPVTIKSAVKWEIK